MFKFLRLSLVSSALTITFSNVYGALPDLSLSLEEPSWSFLIDNESSQATELTDNERRYLRDLQPALQKADYKTAERTLSERDSSDDSAAFSLLRGQILLTNGKDEQAIVHLKKAVESHSDFAASQRSLGLAYLRTDSRKLARQHLQKAIELGDQSAQLYGQLAYLNLREGMASSAISGYQQALFLDADNEEWARGLLYALTRAEALSQAQALAEQLLEKQSSSKELWMLRSQIALRQSKPLQALSSLESAISLGEEKAENLIIAAQLHLKHGSTERSVELLTSRKVMNPSMTAQQQQAVIQTAALLAQNQQWDQLQTLLKASSNSGIPAKAQAALSISQARMAIETGNHSGAEKALKSALRNDPTMGDALITLADLLRDQKRYQQAIMYYQRAEVLPDLEERALLGRAQAHIEQSEYDEALRLLGQVVRKNPTRQDLHASMRSLRNMTRNRR
jgi:tetratricopeptide (TPR) repeat protein